MDVIDEVELQLSESLVWNGDLCCWEKTSREFGFWALSSPVPSDCHWRCWPRASPFLQFHLMSLTPSLKCLFQQHHPHYLLQSSKHWLFKIQGSCRNSWSFYLLLSIHATNLWIFGETSGPTTPDCICNFPTLFLAIVINTGHIICGRVQGNGIKSLESNLTFRAVCQKT